MRVLLCKLCEYVCKLENGRHNLVGVFDDIRVNGFPVDHPSFFLAFQLEAAKEDMGKELNVAAVFKDPHGKEVLRSDLKGTIPSNPGMDNVRMFAFAPVNPVRFTAPGDYVLEVTSNGTTIHTENVPIYNPAPSQQPSRN